MRTGWSLCKCLSGVVACLTLIQCSTMRQSSSGGGSGKAVRIELKGTPDTESDTRYFSSSRILTYTESTQLVRDKTEAVDFTVNTKVKFYDPKTSILKFKVKTIRKDGQVDLHDLAFPELKEEIDYIVAGRTAQVIQAGSYNPEGLFYIPSVPIPKEPVQVGDTWTMQHTWASATESIPLTLDIVGILKNIVSCEGGKTCADIEISGGVELMHTATKKDSGFKSKLWGRMLFSLDRGDVIWSEIRSIEEMNVVKERTVVSSCMVSETKLAKNYRIKFECDPKEAPVPAPPNF